MKLSPAFLTVGMLGVVGLLVTGYFAKKMFAVEQRPGDPLINVPMALQNLTPGTKITDAHLALGPAREGSLSREIVRTSRILVGRVVKNAITAAEPISTLDLYGPGEGPAPDIEPGMRAVTVPISANTVAAAGQYVDVHFTPGSDPEAADNGGRIMTLFKGIKLLSIETNNRSTISDTASVTLELTPEQANIILLAKDRGDLNLVYTPEGKGHGGVAVNDEDRATLYEILGYTPKPAQDPVKPFETEVFRGSGRQVHSFRDGKYTDSLDQSDLFRQGNEPQNAPPVNNNWRGPTANANDAGDQGQDREVSGAAR